MKTCRTFLLITGILIGIIALFSTSVKANNQEKNEQQETTEARLNLTELMETESILIDNYLQITALSNSVETIIILNEAGSVVYKGVKSEAADLLPESSFLFEHNNRRYFLVQK